MLCAITPIEPPDGDRCWAFHLINDTTERIDEVRLESVSYEWGDSGNSEDLGRAFGPLAPGRCVEIYRETDTEVRTTLELRVKTASGETRMLAESGRLYRNRAALPIVPILGRPGKLIELEHASSL